MLSSKKDQNGRLTPNDINDYIKYKCHIRDRDDQTGSTKCKTQLYAIDKRYILNTKVQRVWT